MSWFVRWINHRRCRTTATEASVLILGESGTGKELRSRRKDRPLVRVNCASIPKDLFESEFFGHTRGAFTGAVKDRAGRFEAAEGGTIFLDEIGEVPLDLQGKLLRVLQEKSYERVGEDRTRGADVRVIAATNRNLQRQVEAGQRPGRGVTPAQGYRIRSQTAFLRRASRFRP